MNSSKRTLWNKIGVIVKNPKVIVIKILHLISPVLSDRIYLKILFPLHTGYCLNLKNPKTYNEKLQWLKLYFRKPIMPILADKYESKKITTKLIGHQFVAKTYGVWNTFDEIEFEKLPEKFVLKTTHDTGGVIINNYGSSFNKQIAKVKLEKHLSKNNYYINREWPYSKITPRIMAEELLEDKEKNDLWDYKFFCFDGKVKAMFIATDRLSTEEVKFNFFDKKFQVLDIVQTHPRSNIPFQKPKAFEKMVNIAEILSKGFPHIRIDLYNIDGKIYVGEYTFYHHGGLVSFHPSEWDYIFGSYINLPKKENYI